MGIGGIMILFVILWCSQHSGSSFALAGKKRAGEKHRIIPA